MEQLLLPQWAESEASPVHLWCPLCFRVGHPMPHVYKVIEETLKAGLTIWCYGDECEGHMVINARMDAHRWGIQLENKGNVSPMVRKGKGKRQQPKGGKL